MFLDLETLESHWTKSKKSVVGSLCQKNGEAVMVHPLELFPGTYMRLHKKEGLVHSTKIRVCFFPPVFLCD